MIKTFDILLSIIIPAYNAEPFLERTVNSIIKEINGSKQVEILIVDDGSTDNTASIIEKINLTNKEIIINNYFKENGGLSDTRNFGIYKALGKYIWFFDSDDSIEKNSISKIIAILKNQDIDLLSFEIRENYQDSRKIQIVNKKRKPTSFVVNGTKYLSDYNIDYSACTFIVRKDILLINNIFFLKGVLSEDYEFPLRLYKYCNKITHIDEVFYNYIIREGSLSRRKTEEYFLFHHESMIKLLQNLYQFIEQINDKKYAKALEKHITKIKLVAIGTLLKSTIPLKTKKEYYTKFKDLGIFRLQNVNLVKKTMKQRVIVFLVMIKMYYITMILLSKKI